eukprot:COSAG01_NODE_48287_length_382_cov_2.554770_1_plen_31_part_10
MSLDPILVASGTVSVRTGAAATSGSGSSAMK